MHVLSPTRIWDSIDCPDVVKCKFDKKYDHRVSGQSIDYRVTGFLIVNSKCNSQVYWAIKTFIEGMSKIVIILKDSELSIVEVIM